jgi:hypothetical protein
MLRASSARLQDGLELYNWFTISGQQHKLPSTANCAT